MRSPRIALPAMALLAVVAAFSSPVKPGAAPVVGAPMEIMHATPIPIESLSPSQRTSLPDTTAVVVAGRTVTLATLRSEHVSRMARLFSGAQLGQTIIAKLGPIALPTTNPWKLVNGRDPHFNDYAKDYQDFCNWVQPTLCAYLPQGTTLTLRPGAVPVMIDIDPLITDPGLCSSGGGFEVANQGCEYEYPTQETVQFFPGSPNPTYKFMQSCEYSSFSYVNDPHGAAQIKYTGPAQYTTPSAGIDVCFVKVDVPSN